jgi:hypothetical protein
MLYSVLRDPWDQEPYSDMHEDLMASKPAMNQEQFSRLFWYYLWYLIPAGFLIVGSYALGKLVSPSYPSIFTLVATAAWALAFHLAGMTSQYKLLQQFLPPWVFFLFNFFGFWGVLMLIGFLDGEPIRQATPRRGVTGLWFALLVTFLGPKHAD